MRRLLACSFALASLSPLLSAGDRAAFAEGVRLLRAGQAEAALAKLAEAETSYGDEVPASLLADLAIASFEAGESARAETYAERAAAEDAGFGFLRDTIVGAARLGEGRTAFEGGKLDEAMARCRRAISAFEAALTEQPASAEARRNLERALKLQQEIEQQKQQQEEQQKDDEQQKQDKDKEEDKKDKEDKEEKPQPEQKEDPSKGGEEEQKKQQPGGKDRPQNQDPQQQKPDEAPQDPEKKDEPQKDQQQDAEPKPSDGGKAEDRPEPQAPPRELSPEETQRLMRALEELQQQKIQLRRDRRPRHVPGKRDW